MADGRAAEGIRRRGLRDDVHERLLQLLLSGDIVPGERLAIDTIARQLAVSESTISRALKAAMDLGFVEIQITPYAMRDFELEALIALAGPVLRQPRHFRLDAGQRLEQGLELVAPVEPVETVGQQADLGFDGAGVDAHRGGRPLRRIGDPEADIGRAVAFLISDDAAYITGNTVGLDGGAAFIR